MVEMFHSSRVDWEDLSKQDRFYCASTYRGAMVRQVEKMHGQAFRGSTVFRLFVLEAKQSATFGEYVGDYDGSVIDRAVMEIDDCDAVPFRSAGQDVGTTNYCVRPLALVVKRVELWQLSFIGDADDPICTFKDFRLVCVG